MYRYLLLCCFLVILADRHAQFRFIPGPQFEPCQFLALHDSRDSWTGHPFRDFCQIHTNLANKMPKSSKCTVVWFINSEFLLQFSQKKHEENMWSFMNFPLFCSSSFTKKTTAGKVWDLCHFTLAASLPPSSSLVTWVSLEMNGDDMRWLVQNRCKQNSSQSSLSSLSLCNHNHHYKLS